MDPLTLMLAGTGMKMIAQYGANIQQSIAEKANAAFYREQLLYNVQAVENDIRAAQRETGYKLGMATTTYGASGIDVGTGSALGNLATIVADGMNEVAFIRRKGDMEIKLSQMRASSAQAKADTLASPTYNLTQAATTGFGNLLAAQKDSTGATSSKSGGGTYLGNYADLLGG